MLYASLLEVVRVFDEKTGAYLHSIEPKDKGWINHISFINDKVVLGFHSGPPATAQYDTNAKKWIVSPLFDSPELDKTQSFSRSLYSESPNATYARFGDLLWQTSHTREQRIYNVATERHVRSLNHLGNVGGHLFENGFGLVWSMSGSERSHTYILTHLYFDSTPAAEPEKKQEVKAPEVNERAVPSNPPAVAEPVVRPVS